MTEADIMHERGDWWVARDRAGYTVLRNGVTHSVADSSYARSEDGLSLAIARCNYKAKVSESST